MSWTMSWAAPRPNVVVVVADDLGWGDLRCYNPESKIPTPQLDKLAKEGLRFTDAHSPSSVCTPTRYSLLTGRYAWRTRLQSGVLWGYSPPLIDPRRPTLASVLSKAGYRTAGFGKWHLGLDYPTREPAAFGDLPEPAADVSLIDYARPFRSGPLTAGFQTFFGIPASLDMDPYFFLVGDRVERAPSGRTLGGQHQRQGGTGFFRAGPAAPEFSPQACLPRVMEEAEMFLWRQPTNQPFFLYVALTAPHDPWVPSPAWKARSGAGDYGDFVAQVDDRIGSLLRVLEKRELARQTLVLVTSDNGAHWTPDDIRRYGHQANGAWRGMKADLFEGGHRVPLLARWPAGHVAEGTETDALVGLQDVFATVLDVCRVPTPSRAGEDSLSFRRVLEGGSSKRRSLVHHSVNGSFALREGRWKLLLTADSGGWSEPTPGSETAKGRPTVQLYNLESDPAETGNLAASRPDVVAKMTAALEEMVKDGRSVSGPRATNDVPVRLRKASL